MTFGFLTALYPWTKALHVISMVAWMAGMFYLPRLYVYHCELKSGSAESERFKVMAWLRGLDLELKGMSFVDLRHSL